MKKEAYILSSKFACSACRKNGFHFETDIYDLVDINLIPSYVFEFPRYKKQIFMNLNMDVKICDLSHRLHIYPLLFIHKYFVY